MQDDPQRIPLLAKAARSGARRAAPGSSTVSAPKGAGSESDYRSAYLERCFESGLLSCVGGHETSLSPPWKSGSSEARVVWREKIRPLGPGAKARFRK